MSNLAFIMMIIAMIAVFGVLLLGIGAMVKGGAFNEKYGNKLMRLRVILQGVALACMAVAIVSAQK